MTNTILVSHTVGIYCDGSPSSPGHQVELEATLWGSGAWANETDYVCETPFFSIYTGTVNLWAPPAFVNPGSGDYHIGSGSAAVDVGVDVGVSSDIDGDVRPMAFGFDIGADEAPGASLHLKKAAEFPAVNPGETVTYTLSVASAGAHPATDVWLTDTLPALQRAIAVTTTRGSCMAGSGWGGGVACDLEDMTPGERAVITLTTQVTTTLPPRPLRLMRNTAWVTSTETMSRTAHADVAMQAYYVRLNDSPANYATIQAAVDASTQPADVVKVAGYCTGAARRDNVAQVVHLGKILILQGGWNTSFTQRNATSYPTTLDALDQGRVLYVTGDISPTIEGLNITGGSAAGLAGYSSGEDAGGGIYVMTATAVISGNRIFTNTAASGYGGGVCLASSDAIFNNNVVGHNIASGGGGLALDHCGEAVLSENTVISNAVDLNGGGLWIVSSPAALNGNIVISNTARNDGGGLYLALSGATLSDNTIAGNVTGGWGGGLHLHHSEATLSNNTITANAAGHRGGGIHLFSSPATLLNNMVSNNESDYYGGGLYLSHSHATLRGNVLVANTAEHDGGGLDLWMSDATLVNNIVADNWAAIKGSGLRIDASSPRLLHTTIACNTGEGSGVYIENNSSSSYSAVTFTNTVLVSHTVGISITMGNTATLEATLWGGGAWANGADWTGAGTIVTGTVDVWGDPAFVAPDAGDYHIGSGSAAIDKGVSAGATDDVDGDPRPLDGGYDTGADEFKDPALVVTQWVVPDPVLTGGQLTYTIRITNTGNITLTLAITDVLPSHVSPTGVLTWTDVSLALGQVWQQTVPTTVTFGYGGRLTNVVEVVAVEGATGYTEISSDVVKYSVYLPLVQRE